HLLGVGRAFELTAVAVALVAQVGFFQISVAPWSRPPDANVEFVRQHLRDYWHQSAPPTVYWPGVRAKTLWLDLEVNSYFEWPNQTAGVVFSRALAAESMRRIE